MNIEAKPLTVPYNGISHRIVTEVIICVKGDSSKCQKVSGLRDSGATICAISGNKAKELGLISVGKREIGGVHGSQFVDYYMVDVVLPNNLAVASIEAIECNTQEDFIIGMNIITLGDFCVTNYGGKTTMSFVYPSQGKIDFYAQRVVTNSGKIKKMPFQNKRK